MVKQNVRTTHICLVSLRTAAHDVWTRPQASHLRSSHPAVYSQGTATVKHLETLRGGVRHGSPCDVLHRISNPKCWVGTRENGHREVIQASVKAECGSQKNGLRAIHWVGISPRFAHVLRGQPFLAPRPHRIVPLSNTGRGTAEVRIIHRDDGSGTLPQFKCCRRRIPWNATS